ncbi:MAG TPA: hydroxymethylglutaryl-CoA lyase [Chloroflexia bacterium]|nr:hydroxymethylglutaryl-CoA lyase [Chloroflexia bacterium]
MPLYPKQVTIYEVGPRDGLQNEKGVVPTDAKVHYINLLTGAGLAAIEATSFVSPRAIPQLADAAEVMNDITKRPGTRYPVLVPNERGMIRAIEAGATEVAVFTAASESFTQANINSTIAQSLENFKIVTKLAEAHGMRVRGYISTAFGCPYEGYVAPSRVLDVALALLDIGVSELSIGDTIGVGTPSGVEAVFGPMLQSIAANKLAAHFHDTRGTALANVLAAMEMGIATIDASSGGLGGCPYAPGASGNLATEDLLYMLDGMGIETGVAIDKVADASLYILGVLGKTPASKYLQALLTSRTVSTT